ncbi:hypothetical protein [Micromonospora echinaurantiaca]
MREHQVSSGSDVLLRAGELSTHKAVRVSALCDRCADRLRRDIDV